MLIKQDLMKLSKERLCELLLEEWSKDISVSKEILDPHNNPILLSLSDCHHGGPCVNPLHDCINCPRQGNGYTTSSTDETNIQSLKK